MHCASHYESEQGCLWMRLLSCMDFSAKWLEVGMPKLVLLRSSFSTKCVHFLISMKVSVL